MNQNTRTRVSIVLLAIGIYRQHRKLILDIFTAAYIHLIFLFEESNIISRIWCPLDVSISFNELQCHYWFLYVIFLYKRRPYWIRTNVVGFADLHLTTRTMAVIYTFCGSCRIRTYGTFRFSGFQDQCNRPTLPNFQFTYLYILAEAEGFEPSEPFGSAR